MFQSNVETGNARYCITCEQLIRPGAITCVDCEKILDIIAGSPVPSFPSTIKANIPAEPSTDLCCMCSSPTLLGSQFCSECECSMAMVLEDPQYAYENTVVLPCQTNTRVVTQDTRVGHTENTGTQSTHVADSDDDEEIEVVAQLTETELMMQRYEKAKQSGDVMELLDDDDDNDDNDASKPLEMVANGTCESDDEIQFIKTVSRTAT
jgi:hypothetical protein